MDKKTTSISFTSIVTDYVVPLIITVGVAIVLFGRVALIASPKGDTHATFYSLTTGMEDYYEFKTAWKPRLFSNALAAFTAHVSKWILAKTSVPIVKNPVELTIASWTAGWFILSCLFIIWFFKRRSLFYIFGMLAGISFGYLSRLQMAVRVYPWDLPALFFFTVFLLLFIQKKYWWIFAIIPLGIGFKETTFILCVVFLFMDLPWKRRIYMLIGSAMLAAGVRITIDYFVHAPMFFTMEIKPDPNEASNFYLFSNLRSFKYVFSFFINAGTLTAFFILPNANKTVFFLKLIAIPFVLGNMLFGNIIEYRIWFEMIPFALYTMDALIYGDPLKPNPPQFF